MTKVKQVPLLLAFLILPFIIIITPSEGAAKLGSYNVNVSLSSVSGLSSGGYMAVQMHVAFSSVIRGAAIFAGGPYNCAQGQIAKALTDCMSATTPPNLNTAISTTNSYASSGKIDSTAYLNPARVFLFSGTADTTVKPAVMNVLNSYYKHYVKQGSVEYVNTMNAAHTFPTDDRINQNSCTTAATPYISYCNFDGAGQALMQIYDDDLLPRNDGSLTGSFIEFDQSEFIGSGKSMSSTAWLYVPKACASGASCTLHVSFHGCLQTFADIGDKWVKNTGFNKWADTNDIIVLYPQAVKSTSSPSNPNGCWDWWGYLNSNYDTKNGEQMKAVRAMMDRIGKGFVNVPAPSNVEVTGTTDSTVSISWSSVADVAGYNVYRNGAKVNSSPVTLTRYTDSGLKSGTTYNYVVRSVMRSGAESVASSTVVATTTGNPPPLPPPSNVRVIETTSSTVGLRWDEVDGATDYLVYRNGALTPNNPVTGTSYTDTKLAAETTYTYRLKSLTEIGVESDFSAPIQATTKNAWTCKTFTASNYAQVQAGRAYADKGYCYANGSNDYMGLYNTFQTTTLAETAKDYYIVGNCP